MRPSLIAGAVALALTACVAAPSGVESAASSTKGPVFRYALEGPSTIGVVQAFDKDGRTYVQFLDIARANPAITDGGGGALGFATIGQYAVLAGVQDDFRVATAFGQVRIYARKAAPAGQAAAAASRPQEGPYTRALPVASGPSPASVSELLAAARSELARAEARVDQLQSQLREIRGSSVADQQARTSLDQHIDQLRSAINQTSISIARVEGTTFPKADTPNFGKSSKEAEESVAPTSKKSEPEKQRRPNEKQPPKFQIDPKEQLLIPVLLRWAGLDSLEATLNGRRITVETLNSQSYTDLPLTNAARLVTGTSVTEASAALLQTYQSYRVPLTVSVSIQDRSFAIVTRPTMEPPKSTITPEMPASREWSTSGQKTLRGVMQAWADAAQMKLSWESKSDFALSVLASGFKTQGTLPQAIGQLAVRMTDLPHPVAMNIQGNTIYVKDAR